MLSMKLNIQKLFFSKAPVEQFLKKQRAADVLIRVVLAAVAWSLPCRHLGAHWCGLQVPVGCSGDFWDKPWAGRSTSRGLVQSMYEGLAQEAMAWSLGSGTSAWGGGTGVGGGVHTEEGFHHCSTRQSSGVLPSCMKCSIGV